MRKRERSRKRGFSILCEEWVLPRKDKGKKKKRRREESETLRKCTKKKWQKKVEVKKREVGVKECGTRSDEGKKINK